MKLTIVLGLLVAVTQVGAKCNVRPPPVVPSSIAPAPTSTDSPPNPTSVAPKPTSAAPEPTSVAPEPTSAAPELSSQPPKPTSAPPTPPAGNYYTIDRLELNKIIPEAAASSYCDGKAAGECANNAIATDAINKALATYKITRRSEAVAIIALQILESDYWKYNTNQYPGRPGQGTRAMLMYPFVYEYAKSLFPAKVQDSWAKLTPIDDASKTQMNSVRALVIADEATSFGAGFWYLTTKTTGYYNNANALRDGNLDDFKAYCVSAVGAEWSPARSSIWTAVDAAIPK
ncbi:hypothetical protein LPJ61_004685 [Coemansia biformis]|uniref:Lysozyme-like protein n=1 Tax=Coemansia biformis TaxID=1286918 RepID=A0A9W7Y846_9FUNG|nr:hypothetical protein LPJ61_004685 [Coemansia biformis]